MIDTKFGSIQVNTYIKQHFVQLRFSGDVDESLYLCTLDEKNLERLCYKLNKTKDQLAEYRERIQEKIRETDFAKLYREFDQRYNKYPIDMARYEAFGKALSEGLIDKLTYDAAEEYYGRLWNYTGD